MATESITNKPRIFVTGTRVLNDGSTTEVSDYELFNNKRQTGDSTFQSETTFMFYGSVSVTMTTDLDTKNYGDYSDRQDARVGKFLDESNKPKAEIRYTVNGKDPSRTKFTIYSDAVTLRKGVNQADDNIPLKARTYYRGQWSETVSVKLKII